MTVDMKIPHGPQSPGLLILFADASLWGRPGAPPNSQSSAHSRIAWLLLPCSPGREAGCPSALWEKSTIDIRPLSSHLCFLPWAPRTFLVTMATVRHPGVGIMPGFGVWNSPSCPWFILGFRWWFLVALDEVGWENKRPRQKRVWGSGSELWLVELGGRWLNQNRFKSWLCHLLVVWPCVGMGPPRNRHCSEKQCARTLLGEVLVWKKSDCDVSLPVSEGEKEREKCLEVSTLWSPRKFGASKRLSEEPMFSRNEPALVSLLYSTLMGCDGFQIQQVHSHGHHTT